MERSSEVADVIVRFYEAFGVGTSSAFDSVVSRDPDAMAPGGGGDNHNPGRQAYRRSTPAKGCPEHDAGIELCRRHLEPAGAPATQHVADLSEFPTSGGELVLGPAAASPGSAGDEPVALELLQPLGQQRARDAGRALQDLTEGRAPQQQIADDDGGPPLGEHLRGAGDGAVALAVLLHDASFPPGPGL